MNRRSMTNHRNWWLRETFAPHLKHPQSNLKEYFQSTILRSICVYNSSRLEERIWSLWSLISRRNRNTTELKSTDDQRWRWLSKWRGKESAPFQLAALCRKSVVFPVRKKHIDPPWLNKRGQHEHWREPKTPSLFERDEVTKIRSVTHIVQ